MMTTINDINRYKSITVNPLLSPDQLFELYSVPSFDNQYPEVVAGKEIGSTKVAVQDNDVLICKINPRINRVWVVKHNTPYPLIASSEWIVVRSPENDSNYLKWYFSSPQFKNLMVSQVTGIGGSLTRAQPKQVATYPVPLPDLPTQRQIADTLDKVSEGIKLCRRMMDELDLMVKAKFVEMFGNIPETEFVTMGSVCSLITDGTHQPPKFVDSGIPFLFVSNITTNMLTYNAEKFISAETYAELMKRTPVEIGDILLSTVGSYGHPAIVKSNKQFSFQRHIAFLKPRHNIIDSTFLHSAILTAGVQRQIEAKVKGIAQKTLNLSEIRTLRFPLPPLQEQERYAALVKNINKSKLTIQEIRDKMETEKLALMQEYFK